MGIVRTRAAVAATTLAFALAACGGASGTSPEEDPKEALREAVDAMEDWDGLSLSMSVEAEGDLGQTGTGEEAAETARMLEVVRGSGVDVSVLVGDVDDPADDEMRFVLRLDSTEAFEVRSVDQSVYVRLDLRPIQELADDPEMQAQIDAFVQQAEAMGITAAGPLVRGEWIEVRGVEQVQRMIEGMAGLPTEQPSPDATATEEAKQAIDRFVSEDVTVTYVGSDDVGDHLRVETTAGDALDLAEQVSEAVGQDLAGAAGQDPFAEMRSEGGEELERTTIPMHVWLADGAVARIAVDMAEIARANPELAEDGDVPGEGDRLAFIADLEEFTGGIEAPEGAVPVDLFELFGRFMQGSQPQT